MRFNRFNGVGVLLAALLGLAAVAGCSSTRMTYLADGRKGYAISCRGLSQNWNSCLVQAGRLCRSKGYAVAYSDEFERELLIGCSGP
jgi:hypothetical protein